MAGKFEIYQVKSGEFHWRLTHTSGRVVAKSGQGYDTKVNAVKGLWCALANVNRR